MRAGFAASWLSGFHSHWLQMYPGDEDNGSMGAWFIFNMLGIYPLSPASGYYVVGSPLFAKCAPPPQYLLLTSWVVLLILLTRHCLPPLTP